MKIGHYCQRQRCKDVESEQFLYFGMLSHRAGLSATAGISCYKKGGRELPSLTLPRVAEIGKFTGFWKFLQI